MLVLKSPPRLLQKTPTNKNSYVKQILFGIGRW